MESQLLLTVVNIPGWGGHPYHPKSPGAAIPDQRQTRSQTELLQENPDEYVILNE